MRSTSFHEHNTEHKIHNTTTAVFNIVKKYFITLAAIFFNVYCQTRVQKLRERGASVPPEPQFRVSPMLLSLTV